jgi:hypothetical protein
MAKTRFRSFSVKKQGFQGFICKKLGAKHNYACKPKGLCAKDQIWTLHGKTTELKG